MNSGRDLPGARCSLDAMSSRAVALPVALATAAVTALAATSGCSGRPARAPTQDLPAPRAFRIERAADLLTGPAAAGTIGDFRLDNGRVAFVISDAPVAFGFSESGGNLVDATRMPGGTADALGQLYLYLDDTFPRQAIYERVEVVRDGAPDTAAVRATGHDSSDPKVRIVTTYSLTRDAQALHLRTELRNTGAAPLTDYQLGDVIAWGHAEHFIPGVGVTFKGVQRGPWIAGVGRALSYAYGARGRELVGPHGSAWSDMTALTVTLAPDAPVVFERRFAVGERGDVGSALKILADEELGVPLVAVRGTVTEDHAGQAGAPVGGAQVSFTATSGGAPWSTALTAADGSFTAWLPLAPALVASATASGRVSVGAPVATPTSGTAERAPLVLRVSQSATLRYRVVERRGSETVASPAKLTFEGVGTTATPDFGPTYGPVGGPIVASASGVGAVVIAPGTYRIFASRGPEFELTRRELTLRPGETLDLELELTRAFATDGYLAADFHQHQLASPDSSVANTDRVIADVAEGLDLAVATDHNQITDLAPAVAEVQPAAPFATVIGLEATTEHIGHFMAYPVTARPHAARGGAPPVNGRPVTDIFAALRALAPDLVVQVNHPRSSDSGYFNLAGLPAAADQPLPATLDLGFDAVEVLNGKRVDDFERVLADWLGLLARGHAITAMGGSDSHAVYGQEAGYPRVWLALGDAPAAVTSAALVDMVKRRRDIVVSNGPFLTWRAGGRSIIGSEQRLPRGGLTTEVTVYAAGWVDVQRLELWRDGVRVETRAIPRATPGPLVVQVPWRLDAPGIYVVVARGDASLAPVVPASDITVTPVAVTNPVWVK